MHGFCYCNILQFFPYFLSSPSYWLVKVTPNYGTSESSIITTIQTIRYVLMKREPRIILTVFLSLSKFKPQLKKGCIFNVCCSTSCIKHLVKKIPWRAEPGSTIARSKLLFRGEPCKNLHLGVLLLLPSLSFMPALHPVVFLRKI